MSNADNNSNQQPRAFSVRAMAAAAVLCVCALLAGIGLTWSAYTGNAFLKGVEVTNATQSLFASDLLVGYYSDPTAEGSTTQLDTRSVVVSTSGDTCSFTFSIYNYLLNDTQVRNDKDVPYTLTVTASGVSGEWSVNSATATGNNTISFGSVTLAGNTAAKYDYTVTLPSSAVGSASFTVKAAVDTSSAGTAQSSIGTKLACLAAKIVPNVPSQVTAASVSGELVDKAGTFEDYDAYNYRITVTGVKTTVKLTWNPDVVELDPYFAQRHSIVETGSDYVTFEMEPGSTVVNFFKNGSPSSWDNLKISVEKA